MCFKFVVEIKDIFYFLFNMKLNGGKNKYFSCFSIFKMKRLIKLLFFMSTMHVYCTTDCEAPNLALY